MHIGKLIFQGLLLSAAWGSAACAAEMPLAALDDSTLAGISAGQSVNTTVNTVTQTLNANSTGNSLTAGTVTSGDVNFADNAFQGFNGINNVVVNTGNNNIIQGSMQVYLTTTTTP